MGMDVFKLTAEQYSAKFDRFVGSRVQFHVSHDVQVDINRQLL